MILTTRLIKSTITFMLLIGCSLTSAAIITVDEHCTITDALNASSKDIQSGACKAGSGVDTIVLPSNGNYVIPIQDRGASDQIESNDSPPVKSTEIIKSCPSRVNWRDFLNDEWELI